MLDQKGLASLNQCGEGFCKAEKEPLFHVVQQCRQLSQLKLLCHLLAAVEWMMKVNFQLQFPKLGVDCPSGVRESNVTNQIKVIYLRHPVIGLQEPGSIFFASDLFHTGWFGGFFSNIIAFSKKQSIVCFKDLVAFARVKLVTTLGYICLKFWDKGF